MTYRPPDHPKVNPVDVTLVAFTLVIAVGATAVVVTLNEEDTADPRVFTAVTIMAYSVAGVSPVKMAVLEATPLSVEGVIEFPFNVYV